MRWQNRQGSDNVEDRRRSGGGGGMGGGGFGIPLRGVSGFVAVIAVMIAGFYGIDLSPILGGGGGAGSIFGSLVDGGGSPGVTSAESEEMARFSSIALRMTEDVWTDQFSRMGRRYTPPRLVLYQGGTSTGCGYGQTAMGPFYCPADQTVYLDVAFYNQLKSSMGGGGDFAQAYVLAHEVGHHVQNLLGTSGKVTMMQQQSSEVEANELSVRLELQADCYAGVFGKMLQDQGILDPGDLEQALNTANAIGDDTLQRKATGRVMPDSFTHGTSQQRYYWFKRGFDSGDIRQCNTFTDMR